MGIRWQGNEIKTVLPSHHDHHKKTGGRPAVDGMGAGVAAFGDDDPLFAAFVSAELAFILNAARLLPGIGRT